MMRKAILFVAVIVLCVAGAWAQTAKDEVMISDCSDVYEFKLNKDGEVIIKNKRNISYQILRQYEKRVQPAIFYGDNIVLNAAACGKESAKYRSVTPDNVFYDDSKVCYFNVELSRKKKECKAKFERTFTDFRYFTQVVLPDEYYIKHKTVTFIIPQSLERFQLVERNLPSGIAVTRTTDGDRTTVTYELTNYPAAKHETQMPPAANVYPTIFITGSFAGAQELFAWGRELADVDTAIPSLDRILEEIRQGCATELDQIKNTFAWVQTNIRYVAFEAGKGKHQPDTPAEVVRKRYGDCKGMALLLKTLLVAQGFDARLTDIGTEDVACSMSETPTLAAINHAICTLEWQGRTYYLDATCSYIPMNHIPCHIQGREALVEEKEGCSARVLPTLPIAASCDSMRLTLALGEQHALMGSVSRWLRGDKKEFLLSAYHSVEAQKRTLFEINALNDDNHANRIDSAHWVQNDCREEWAALAGNVTDSHSLEQLDGDLYMELDPDNLLFAEPIDTAERKQDFVFPLRCRVVREVVFQLPAGYGCESLPQAFTLSNEVADLECQFLQQGQSTILFRKVMSIRQRRLKCDSIATWNDDLRRWNEASHEQIILKKLH
ncbi:MAG: transglutaminase domain-containing protein [Muribaculaceae bacterium]|nr:transglutaminase domain-containing protein [Muribaculaceae bacterium]